LWLAAHNAVGPESWLGFLMWEKYNYACRACARALYVFGIQEDRVDDWSRFLLC
jgi:hypothetical protein